MFGKFCKHLFAVMILFQEAFPNAPGVASGTRHSIAYIAVGETCPPLHFYNSFQTATMLERPIYQNGSETEQNRVTTEVELLDPNSVRDAPCSDVTPY